ncbi:hypothetical protein E0D81_18600 [Lelliottia amnigena]|nr:hypothetical protein E0D81_18600 [Lelliottia amnigena]
MQNGYCWFLSDDLQKNTIRSLLMINQVISITIRAAETSKAILTAQLITPVTIRCLLYSLFLTSSMKFMIRQCDL